MKKPDFFIIGAPKCGTTSLAAWLADHPQVYMSSAKEPHFFNTDEPHHLSRSLSKYENLFEGAEIEHRAVGEASTGYLLSQVAVSNILNYNADARFIVCLRNPVDMAFSLHEQKVFEGSEHITDFEMAWKLSDRRLRGEMLSRLCKESPRRLAYATACALGSQLERLYSQVSRDRICLLLLDDVKKCARVEWEKILAFLNIVDDERVDFPVYNAAKERRSLILHKLGKTFWQIKLKVGCEHSFGILKKFSKYNTRTRPRKVLNPAMKIMLQIHYAPEVEKMERILGRDLSYWLK